MVAKDFRFRTGYRPELFAATPPLETLKLLLSWTASQADDEIDNPMCVLYVDVRRAYFHAPVKQEVYVELPDEDKHAGEDACGRLRLSLYGMRESASNWEEAYSTFLESVGFAKVKASTCCFYNDSRQIRNVVHRDDFVAVGREKDLLWMED